MNEDDKRVKRTRSQLAQALIELSIEQGFDAVTVQSITERAAINYRTFYRHYDSKDDLLRDVLQTTMTDLRKILPPPTPAELNATDFDLMAGKKSQILYEYVAANSDIFKVLLQSGPVAFVPAQELAQAEAERFFAPLALGTIPHKLVVNHMITSTFSFIQWWLDNDMSYTPEQMGEYAAQLIMLPIRRLLLANKQPVELTPPL